MLGEARARGAEGVLAELVAGVEALDELRGESVAGGSKRGPNHSGKRSREVRGAVAAGHLGDLREDTSRAVGSLGSEGTGSDSQRERCDVDVTNRCPFLDQPLDLGRCRLFAPSGSDRELHRTQLDDVGCLAGRLESR